MTSTSAASISRPPASIQLWPWRTIYTGICHAVGASFTSFRYGSQALQRVTMLRVDLDTKGLDFRTTQGTGEGNGLTVSTTITEFVETTPGVVLAINANLSGPPLGKPEVATSQLVGLAVDQGKLVCDPTLPAADSSNDQPNVPNEQYVGCTALMIYKNSGKYRAKIDYATHAHPPEKKDLWAAIAGSRNGSAADGVPRKPTGTQIPFLVQSGEIGLISDDTFTAGRTGVGVSRDGRWLYLVVVEGLENCSPPYGATFFDLANWMLAAGANGDAAGAADGMNEPADMQVWTAVSLDGGGSSVMAKLDPGIKKGKPDPETKRAVMLNIQYGDESTPGLQRDVGNYFGIISNADDDG